ncbi:MAG: glutamate racemase [bacterium]|nr:glutamate racemase [bacterium]
MIIGIFDSGLGGLGAAKAIMTALPDQKVVYFGDTIRLPYGNKPPELVKKYARDNVLFLLKKKADIIVVGCNTASAVAGLSLRKEFPNLPLFEVIGPAVREALRVSSVGRIGVIGTRNTIQSGAYQRWIPKIHGRACPLFVPLVEAGHITEPSTYEIATQYLMPLRRAHIDTLILGCTHYPFLKPVISRIMGGRVTLVDSAKAVAREVAESLNQKSIKALKQKQMPKHEFYVSKKTEKFQQMAEQWLGVRIVLNETKKQ